MVPRFIHSLIYALISGFTEFLPVSASAHRMLYSYLTGFSPEDPVLMLAIRLGAVVALLLCCKHRIKRLRRENKLAKLSRRRRNHHPDVAMLMDLRFLKTALFPVLIGAVLSRWLSGFGLDVALWALLLLLGSAVLALPRITRQGNKNAGSLSRFDGLLIGLGGILGAIPGQSRVGGIISIGQSRGADRGYILDAALILSVPSLTVLLVLDAVAVASALPAFTLVLALIYLLSALISFGTAYLGITLMRYLSVKVGFTGFAYYSFGLAMFCFVLYLVI